MKSRISLFLCISPASVALMRANLVWSTVLIICILQDSSATVPANAEDDSGIDPGSAVVDLFHHQNAYDACRIRLNQLTILRDFAPQTKDECDKALSTLEHTRKHFAIHEHAAVNNPRDL